MRGFEFDWKRFRMPPKMAAAMDEGQQWAVTITAEALADYGYPKRPLHTEKTAVIQSKERLIIDYIFVNPDDQAAVMQATFDLMQTEICQPAMLTLDMAMMALLADYGFKPDIVMGHT